MPHGGKHTLSGLLGDVLADAEDAPEDDINFGLTGFGASSGPRFPDESGTVDDVGMGLMPTPRTRSARLSSRVSSNREPNFDIESGRFHDPQTGEFEPGSPPPDLDTSVDRYRAKDGRFKSRSADLYDEPAEVARDSLEPLG